MNRKLKWLTIVTSLLALQTSFMLCLWLLQSGAPFWTLCSCIFLGAGFNLFNALHSLELAKRDPPNLWMLE